MDCAFFWEEMIPSVSYQFIIIQRYKIFARLWKIFDQFNQDLVRATKEFADYTVDQILGWFNHRICFMKPKMVFFDAIWSIYQKNTAVLISLKSWFSNGFS